MGDYISNWSGSEIEQWGYKIADLENNMLARSSRVNIAMSMCNTTYISNCGGFYEIWGPFVFVQICLRSGASVIPASTQCTLMNAGAFPIPEDNTDSASGAGYASLACQRGPLPYIANTGELRISANGPAVAANTTMFIQGVYIRKMT